jgi:hypothetical protein
MVRIPHCGRYKRSRQLYFILTDKGRPSVTNNESTVMRKRLNGKRPGRKSKNIGSTRGMHLPEGLKQIQFRESETHHTLSPNLPKGWCRRK